MSEERLFLKGNEALAEAAIKAGCLHFFGYPITPQTEVNAYMAKTMPKIGGTYLQAESEVAAANMLLGAAAAGVRAMTSSSSPGISLKTEAISYLAGSDLPCLILNVQRGGPGLGGIQPSQADYFQATKAPGHGDLHIIVLAPSTVQEMVNLVFTAFDLSEKYRVPAMILSDGLLGQMMEPLNFPDIKVQPHDKPWAACGHQNKRKPNIVNSLYLQAPLLEQKVRERFERYAQIEQNEVRCEEYLTEDAEILLVGYGASSRIARSAVNDARKLGIKAGLFRPITLWPFPNKQLKALSEKVKSMLVVELSMGQMLYDVKAAVEYTVPVHFHGRTGGMLPSPADVLEEIKAIAGGNKA